MTTTPHDPYPRPTVAEALCELHFTLPEGREWNQGWFGDLFKRVENEFPHMEPQQGVEIGAIVGPDALIPHVRQLGLRMTYKHGQRPHLVQLAPNLLTVNELSTYPGWDTFVTDIHAAWDHVREVVEPATLSRVGLRYINRIPRDDPQEPVAEWLAESGYYPDRVREQHSRFYSRIEIALEEGLRLIVIVAEGKEEDGRPILLDIDTILEATLSTEWSAVEPEIDRLHEHIWDVFHTARTPWLERLLQGESHD